MPVEFLTDEEAVAYGQFNDVLSRPELERVFCLDGVDKTLIAKPWPRPSVTSSSHLAPTVAGDGSTAPLWRAPP